MLCGAARAWIWAWFHAYENLQFLAVILLYSQIGCSLIGSLGVSYIGLLLANLAIALFALVAIENRSQTLARTYAVLLIFALLLDIVWLVLFSVEIRLEFQEADAGKFTAFSLKVVLVMQALGFFVRFFSAFVWLQMYRLGVQDQGVYQQFTEEGHYGRSGTPGLFSPMLSPRPSRMQSFQDDSVGGSIYNQYQSSVLLDKFYGNVLPELEEETV